MPGRTRARDILAIVFSAPALRRCVPTALIVGSILSAINQGGVITAGNATALTWVRVGFNFLIPFTVANVGYCSAALARGSGDPGQDRVDEDR